MTRERPAAFRPVPWREFMQARVAGARAAAPWGTERGTMGDVAASLLSCYSHLPLDLSCTTQQHFTLPSQRLLPAGNIEDLGEEVQTYHYRIQP